MGESMTLSVLPVQYFYVYEFLCIVKKNKIYSGKFYNLKWIEGLKERIVNLMNKYCLLSDLIWLQG